MKILISELGREKKNVVFLVSDRLTPEQIAKILVERSTGYLISRYIWATWDSQTLKGSVFAGFHCVGKAMAI